MKPIGSTSAHIPLAESQARPLGRLKDPEKQITAWSRAVELAGGGQPTAKQITQVVADLLAEDCPSVTQPKPTREQNLAEAFESLSEAVRMAVPDAMALEKIEGIIARIARQLRLQPLASGG